MAAAESLYDLLGRVDNLDDPVPPLDRPAVALTLTSVFLVRYHPTIAGVGLSLSEGGEEQEGSNHE